MDFFMMILPILDSKSCRRKSNAGNLLKPGPAAPQKKPGERKVLQARKLPRRGGAVQAAGLFLFFFQLDPIPLELGIA
jgi:hypothetical protein